MPSKGSYLSSLWSKIGLLTRTGRLYTKLFSFSPILSFFNKLFETQNPSSLSPPGSCNYRVVSALHLNVKQLPATRTEKASHKHERNVVSIGWCHSLYGEKIDGNGSANVLRIYHFTIKRCFLAHSLFQSVGLWRHFVGLLEIKSLREKSRIVKEPKTSIDREIEVVSTEMLETAMQSFQERLRIFSDISLKAKNLYRIRGFFKKVFKMTLCRFSHYY